MEGQFLTVKLSFSAGGAGAPWVPGAPGAPVAPVPSLSVPAVAAFRFALEVGKPAALEQRRDEVPRVSRGS